MRIEEDKPLAPFTTFGIGGPARFFVHATTEEEIAEAAGWARDNAMPLFVLGGGSNLLVSDAGFRGLVLSIGLLGISIAEDVRHRIYRVAAGENWDAFVERAVHENCAGIECLAGIPGTAGGTPVQNVGAYGQEVASTIVNVRAFDLQKYKFIEFTAADCGFAYRRSRFNSAERGRYIVTRVDYSLEHGGAPTLRYADLQRAFSDGSTPALAQVAEAVRAIRQSKGMLLVEGDPDCHSAGSFFKNPAVNPEQLKAITAASEDSPPLFPAGDEPEHAGKVKIPAAWLIEHAGFAKGFSAGAAAISSRHTLALVNRDGATACDILSLARQIRSAVESRFGVRLEMEPVLVGFDQPAL